MCVRVGCVCVCECEYGAHRGKRRVSDSLDLGLREIVRFLVWVMDTSLTSSVRAVYALE